MYTRFLSLLLSHTHTHTHTRCESSSPVECVHRQMIRTSRSRDTNDWRADDWILHSFWAKGRVHARTNANTQKQSSFYSIILYTLWLESQFRHQCLHLEWKHWCYIFDINSLELDKLPGKTCQYLLKLYILFPGNVQSVNGRKHFWRISSVLKNRRKTLTWSQG